VPQALQFGLVYEKLPDGRELADHSVCAIKREVIPHSFEVSSFVFFVAPMTLISVLYALIGMQLRRSSLRGGCNSVRLKTGVGGCSPQHKPADGRRNLSKHAQIKATKHVVKMLGECQNGYLWVMSIALSLHYRKCQRYTKGYTKIKRIFFWRGEWRYFRVLSLGACT